MMAPKLSADVQKKLLCFNSAIPYKNMVLWVTIEEMRERLVHIGVVRMLSIEMLQTAIKQVGNGLITRRRDWGTSYYRPTLLDHECGTPFDQRTKVAGYSNRLPLFPPKDFLKVSSEESRNKLEYVNRSLREYEDELLAELIRQEELRTESGLGRSRN